MKKNQRPKQSENIFRLFFVSHLWNLSGKSRIVCFVAVITPFELFMSGSMTQLPGAIQGEGRRKNPQELASKKDR